MGSEIFMSKQLSMSAGEIVTSYKQAKDKKKQITILSQLNLCTTDEIIEILKANGIDGRSLPRTKKDKSASTPRAKNATGEKKSKNVSKDNVFEYIKHLKERRSQLMMEVGTIDAELNEIAIMCNQEGTEQ